MRVSFPWLLHISKRKCLMRMVFAIFCSWNLSWAVYALCRGTLSLHLHLQWWDWPRRAPQPPMGRLICSAIATGAICCGIASLCSCYSSFVVLICNWHTILCSNDRLYEYMYHIHTYASTDHLALVLRWKGVRRGPSTPFLKENKTGSFVLVAIITLHFLLWSILGSLFWSSSLLVP